MQTTQRCGMRAETTALLLQVATEAEVFVFDLPAVAQLPGFSACAASFLAASVPLKLGVGVVEDLKLLARCVECLSVM